MTDSGQLEYNYRHESGELVYVRRVDNEERGWLVVRADETTKRIRDLELSIRYTRIMTPEQEEQIGLSASFVVPGTRYLGLYRHRTRGTIGAVRVGLDADPTYLIKTADNDDLTGVRRRLFVRAWEPLDTGIICLDRYVSPVDGMPVTIVEFTDGCYGVVEENGAISSRVLSVEQYVMYDRVDPRKFWMVVGTTNERTKHKHETLAQATAEAQRLAASNHGETFTVTEAVTAFLFVDDAVTQTL